MALTGRNFSQRPSQLLKIEDERLALDFDFTCTARLKIFDEDLERVRLEAMTGATIAKQLGPILGQTPVRVVTQTDIGDQGF